jgi:hypothetical protein
MLVFVDEFVAYQAAFKQNLAFYFSIVRHMEVNVFSAHGMGFFQGHFRGGLNLLKFGGRGGNGKGEPLNVSGQTDTGTYRDITVMAGIHQPADVVFQ